MKPLNLNLVNAAGPSATKRRKQREGSPRRRRPGMVVPGAGPRAGQGLSRLTHRDRIKNTTNGGD